MTFLLPRLLATGFLLTEEDFYCFCWILAPVKEPFLAMGSSFITAFLGGGWGGSSGIPYSFWALSRFIAISSASSSLSIMILMAFLFCRGNIISLAILSSFDEPSVGFLNYFTLSAYLKVLSVFSEEAEEGDTFPIMTVLQKPTKESLRTMVNLDPLKGVWPFPWSSARMHSFRESRDLLIYAPSILVCLPISM